MAAVELKALPWQHIDPSSIILGPEIKLEKWSVEKKTHFILVKDTVWHLSFYDKVVLPTTKYGFHWPEVLSHVTFKFKQ